MSIIILDPHVANLIAAGEVVERPASIVKELVDNAIDAGATSIDICIEDGGKQLLEIRDNGSGMSVGDIRLAVVRHATSKIRTEADLSRVVTLGFRGEALASIASVSELIIESKQRDSLSGWKLVWESGKLIQEDPIGMSDGTIVRVKNLFTHTPARLKFLKQGQTEARHIVEEFMRQAVAHESVGLSLRGGGRNDLIFPSESQESRIERIFTPEVFGAMVKVMYDHTHWKLSGWVGLPQLGQERGIVQYLIVNGRCVTDRLVVKAVREAMGGLLMPRMQVPWVLFLELPADMVDINVHPRKEEVRFANSSTIWKAVVASVQAAMNSEDLRHMRRSFEQPTTHPTPTTSSEFLSPLHTSVLSFEANLKLPHLKTEGYVSRSSVPTPTNSFFTKNTNSFIPHILSLSDVASIEIAQMHALYLITEDVHGIRILDQHAVHERVLYEQFINSWRAKKIVMQPLLVPVEVSISADIQELMNDFLPVLENLGFNLSYIDDVVSILGIPSVLSERRIITLFREFLGDLAEQDLATLSIDTQTDVILKYMACRSAVKAGDRLDEQVRRKLLHDLEVCRLPFTCPHGRPVEIVLSWKELEERFKRVV